MKIRALTAACILSPVSLLVPQSSLAQNSEISAHSSSVISGEFNLINHLGETVTEKTYNGQYRLVFFGFTECPDICPLTMANIGKALRQLDEEAVEQIKPLFISVDTETDTIERLAQYVTYFHPTFDGLTGSPEQISVAAEGFNSTFGKNVSDNASLGSYYHSSYIYLMNKNGQLLDVLSHATSADMLVERLRELP